MTYLLQAADAMQTVEGSILYVVAIDPINPDAIWVTEVWRTQADHQGSLALESTQALIAKARPLIAGFGERFETIPMGGKGIPKQTGSPTA